MSEPLRLTVRLGLRHVFSAEGPADIVNAQFRLWCDALVTEWIKEAEGARSSTLRHLMTLRKARRALADDKP